MGVGVGVSVGVGWWGCVFGCLGVEGLCGGTRWMLFVAYALRYGGLNHSIPQSKQIYTRDTKSRPATNLLHRERNPVSVENGTTGGAKGNYGRGVRGAWWGRGNIDHEH